MITIPYMMFAQMTGERIPPEQCAITGDGVILIKEAGKWIEVDPKLAQDVLLVSLRQPQ